MTRINLFVPPIDEHVRRARDESPRIATHVRKLINTNALHRLDSAPTAYTVQTADNPKGGKGHMMFFCNKLKYVERYYQAVRAECEARGFNGGEFGNRDAWPHLLPKQWHTNDGQFIEFWNDYQPTLEAIAINKKRMIERIPAKPHYKGKLITRDHAIELIMCAA